MTRAFLLVHQVWRAGSGHLLVRPQINGQEGGLMVVDTGASGFVITPRAAVALGLDSFGELFAASISGKVRVGDTHMCSMGYYTVCMAMTVWRCSWPQDTT